MLSDEEKQVIEELKNKKADYFMISNLTGKTLVNLIKKQSKEIEELKNGQIDFWISDKEIEERIRNKFVSKEEAEQKEKKAYIDGTNVAHELCNKMWKNKIKAKIEEIENTGIDVAWEQVNYTIREQDRAKIQVLQSLLEKE